MSAYVLLNLLNKLGKRDRNELNKFIKKNTNVRFF